jgi:predicted porin
LNANYSHVDLESVDDIGGGNKIYFHYQLNATPKMQRASTITTAIAFWACRGWGAFKMGTNENVYERFMYTAIRWTAQWDLAET